MSEQNDELKKELVENGTFSPEKAAALRGQAMSKFREGLRKIERIAWTYILVSCVVGVWAYCRFMLSTDTRGIVGFGLLMLVAVEIQVLIKLWYWIVSNKIGVLKELKQLRLEVAGGPSSVKPDKTAEIIGGRAQGLPRWERYCWIGGILLATAIVATYTSLQTSNAPVLTSSAYITLAPDGSGSIVDRIASGNFGVGVVQSWKFDTDASYTMRWVDRRGRDLPVTVTPDENRKRYEIKLIEPVLPGERLTYTQIADGPKLATKKDDLWTYRREMSYPAATNEFNERVLLPKGAHIVSVKPEPMAQFTSDGQTGVEFHGRRGRDEAFQYTIEYRLPAAEADRHQR